MKKITFALIACVFCLSSVFAQKYGHINSSEIMKVMPGVDSIQIKLADFQKDLEIFHTNMVNEFQTKYDKFDKEAGTMSTAVRKIREDELRSLQTRIQEFEYNVQDDFEEEQARLIAPFQEKLQNAINEVAKEYKYNYIFDTQTLLYYYGVDDVSALIKKKLGIK
jgi:outer membrane protein